MKDIILFLSDQHTQNIIGYENQKVDTPFFNEVANNGLVYNHCMCNAPLCVPSRMSFLSGKSASHLNIFNNDTTLGIDVPTMAHALKLQGYKSVLIGRMHFKGDDQLHGFDEHLAQDITSQYWGRVEGKEEEYGAFHKTTQMKYCQSNVGSGYSPVHAYDEHVVETALEYIKYKSDEPHFIVIGFYGPHFPYACENALYTKYQGRLSLDNTYYEPCDEAYASLQQESTPVHVRNIKAAYYGNVETLDGYVKQCADYLSKHEVRETVYFYTSDHGDQCGRRGLFGKQTLYEDALKVPLLIWGKSIEHKRIETPVSLLDISRTILDMGNASLHEHEGTSLLKLEDNHFVHVEHCLDAHGLQIIEALYFNQYKLVQINGKLRLYNIIKDEAELNDLSYENSELVNKMQKHLLSNNEKRDLIEKEIAQRANHEILKKWGTIKQPNEFARFINPKKACGKAKENKED